MHKVMAAVLPVLLLAAAWGCSKVSRKEAVGDGTSRPATQASTRPPDRAAQAAQEPAYDGRTARQWLECLREAEHGTDEWRTRSFLAAEALVALGGHAVPSLMAAMKDERWDVREFAAFTLGKLGDPAAAAMPVLIEGMRDKNFLVIEAAETAVGNLGMSSDKALALITELLSSDDPFVRGAMAVQLGLLGSRARPALPALEKLTRDADAKARQAAAEAISLIKSAP